MSDKGPQEKKHAVITIGKSTPDRSRRRRENIFLFRKNDRQQGKHNPDQAADNDAPDFYWRERFKAALKAFATAAHVCAAARENWSEPMTSGLLTISMKPRTLMTVPMKIPAKLSDELFARLAPSR